MTQTYLKNLYVAAEKTRLLPRKIIPEASGSISLLIAAVLVPMLFMLFFLSIDLTGFLNNYNNQQRKQDLQALTESKLMRPLSSGYTTTGSPETYFNNHFAGTASKRVSYRTSSSISFRPVAAGIIVDASRYLAPAIPIFYPPISWKESLQLPASTFFKASSFSVKTESNFLLTPLDLTQRCFNPYFSLIKRTALGIYDLINQNHANTIQVTFLPQPAESVGGKGNAPEPIRNYEESNYTEYQSRYSRSLWCENAADETIFADLYQTPAYLNSLHFGKDNHDAGDQAVSERGNLPGNRLRIWSHPVIEEKYGITNKEIENAAISLVFDSPARATGNLSTFKKHYLFILTGSFPDEFNQQDKSKLFSNFSESLTNISNIYKNTNSRLNLFFLYFRDTRNLYSNPEIINDSRVNEIVASFNKSTVPSHLKVEILNSNLSNNFYNDMIAIAGNMVSEPLITQ